MTRAPQGQTPPSTYCTTHRQEHGPEGCPICRHFVRQDDQPYVVGLPVEEPSLNPRDHVKEFWTNHGRLTLGAAILGLASLMFLKVPGAALRNDPAPYQKSIIELETVLFYSGASDPVAHPKMVSDLLDALGADVGLHPPETRPEFLKGSLVDLKETVHQAPPGQFTLVRPRKLWIQIRDAAFVKAPWFRAPDDALDQVQMRLQPTPPDPVAQLSNAAALEAMDSYYRVAERFAARAGSLAAAACRGDADRNTLNADLRSLATGSLSELDALTGAASSLPGFADVTYQAMALVNDRSGRNCGVAVPTQEELDRRLARLRAAIAEIRYRVTSGGPPA